MAFSTIVFALERPRNVPSPDFFATVIPRLCDSPRHAAFFRQLLLYHLPHLHNQLEEAGVAPVVYATPWFITLFAYKNPLHVIMRLWHEYIRRGDPTFVPFLAVALMELEKLGSIGRDNDPCALSNVLAGFLHVFRHPS